MEGRMLHQVLFFLLCVFFIADSSIAEKTRSEAIKEIKKLNYEETQTVFPSSTTTARRDALPGKVPTVNPITPDATPTTTPTAPASSGGAWCIASPTASDTALQVALDYACGYGGADCSAIQPNAACYDPNTVRDHASYAFNYYYQKNPIPTSCVFGGTAQLSNTDPSHGNCHHSSPTSTPTTTPKTPPTIQTPPIIQTPPSTINPYTSGGGSDFDLEPTGNYYSGEPTGTSNSAGTISRNLQHIIGLMLSLVTMSFI